MKVTGIENMLILVNLLLILYLVYVLSNRTIEQFYHEGDGLDPSVPGFEPHTHRDSTRSPGNIGCESSCSSGGWERPPVPSIVKSDTLVSDQDAISITDNTLTISNITLSESIDHPFYDLWYFQIYLFQNIAPDPGARKVNSIIINDTIVNGIVTTNLIYKCNLSNIFRINGTSKGNIIIDLSEANVTNNFSIYLGVLDENENGVNEDMGKYTFEVEEISYTPCTTSGEPCTSDNDCCGTEAVCSGGTCQPCSPNYYSNTDGICVSCDPGQKPNSDNSGCVPCDDNDYDWSGSSCQAWQCGNQPSPVQMGNRRDGVSESCPLTRQKNCTNACYTPSCPLGLRWDWVSSITNYQCCRPTGLGNQDGASDCGGENDSEKRTYPCCGNQTCNLVKYKSPTGRRPPTHHYGHRCINNGL